MYTCMHTCMNLCIFHMYVCIYTLCMYVCTCMYACRRVCMHVDVYACMYVSIYVSMYLCIYLCIYISMYRYIYIYISMYLCIYVSMYLHMYVCMCVSMCVCMYACIYVFMYVSVYLCTYVSVYVSMYVCICASVYLCIYVSMYVCIYVCIYVSMCVSMSASISMPFTPTCLDCPPGVGYTVVLIAFYTDFFYNIIIAWALYFFFASFTSDLPWTSCNNTWNTPDCYDGHLLPPGEGTPGPGPGGSFGANLTYLTNLSPNSQPASDASARKVVEIVTEIGIAANATTEEPRISPALEFFEYVKPLSGSRIHTIIPTLTYFYYILNKVLFKYY